MPHSGGCYCGEPGFECSAEPVETDYCHYIYSGSRVGWLALSDDLPNYENARES